MLRALGLYDKNGTDKTLRRKINAGEQAEQSGTAMTVMLSIVMGTRNRLELLKQTLTVLLNNRPESTEIIVIDAGSGDGTQDYVRSLTGVRLVEDGRPVGQAKSLNRVLETLKTEYVCWLSDDNVVVPGMLDMALDVLNRHSDVGLVGLKVKDMLGPHTEAPYIGGIWETGVLNVNQGIVRFGVMKEVGFFDERYPDYGIDPDLTTSVLLAGHKVVFTKQVAVMHYRDHDNAPGAIENTARGFKQKQGAALYFRKYESLVQRHLSARIGLRLAEGASLMVRGIYRLCRIIGIPLQEWTGYNGRDWSNVLTARYISPLDLWRYRKENYHLVQFIPAAIRHSAVEANLHKYFPRPIRHRIDRWLGLVLGPRWLKLKQVLIRQPAINENVLETIISREGALWNAAIKRGQLSKQRILIATSTGGHEAMTSVEGTLGLALTLRGANVEYLLCDQVLPGCLQAEHTDGLHPTFVKHGSQGVWCEGCYAKGLAALAPLDLLIRNYSQWVNKAEFAEADRISERLPFDEIASYRLNGAAIGEHSLAGALRYFGTGTLTQNDSAESVLRKYFKAGLITAYAINNLLDAFDYDVICFHHGIYVPQGIIGEVARHRGIRVVNWNPAYRKQCFIFTHGDTYHHKLKDEPPGNWEDIAWNEQLEAELMTYLKSRWEGSDDWIWFHEKPYFEANQIAAETGIDFNKPLIGLLTNVIWDAQLHYPNNAFNGIVDWVLETIDYFIRRPDLQLVVRIHPAEIRGTRASRQPMEAEIRKRFPRLPSNIIIIPPDSHVSTYAVMARCDSVLIYGTKTGVELASMGIPVIVAGEAWIRNKGLTIDARSAQDYFDILGRLPLKKGMDQAQIRRARKYAYHFFFRRMIPLSFMQPTGAWPPYKIHLEKLNGLANGNDAGLDAICNGILNQSEFIFQAEKFADPA